jgi:hypothetical protein
MSLYIKMRCILVQLPHKRQVAFALYCASDVKHLSKHSEAHKCLELVEKWLKNEEVSSKELSAAAYAVATAANAAAAHAAYAAAHAAYAAAHAAYAAASAAAHAANATAAAHAAYAAADAYAAAAYAADAAKQDEYYAYLINSFTELEQSLLGVNTP